MYKADSYQQSIGCFQTCGCCWGIQIILWIFRHQCKSTYFSALTGDWLHNIHTHWIKSPYLLKKLNSVNPYFWWFFGRKLDSWYSGHFIWKIALIILRNFFAVSRILSYETKNHFVSVDKTKVGHKIELEWRVWHMVWIAKWSV